MKLGTTQAILDYLSGKTNYEREADFDYERLDLRGVERLLKVLGDPQKRFRSCHIAGSKGKGSAAEMVAAAMAHAGHRVGLYTSPHVTHLRQRIRIRGRSIAEAGFVEVFDDVRLAVERVEREGCKPTFFDIMTATAFTAFHREAVPVAVIETGLGGRLDSTNCVRPDVAAITTVEMDHADKLGDTLAAIAGEKAGIIKKGVPVVIGPLPDEAAAVIRERAAEAGSAVDQVGQEIVIANLQVVDDGSRFDLRTKDWVYAGLTIRMLGRGQVENAAVAVGVLERWSGCESIDISREAIRSGLNAARLPGRIQKVRDNPLVLIDGAHTPSSARMLREVIEERMAYRRVFGVLAILSDKGIEEILDQVVPLCQEVVLTRAPSPRCVPPVDLAEMVRKRFPWAIVYPEDDPADAIRKALSLAKKDDMVCITGSMYLAGEAIRFFR